MASCHLIEFKNNTRRTEVHLTNHETGESLIVKPAESKILNWPVPDASSQGYLEEGHFLEIRFMYSYATNEAGEIVSAGSIDPRASAETQILIYRNDYQKVLQHVIRYDGEISDRIADGDFDKSPPGLGGYQYFQRTGTDPVWNEIPNAGNNTSYRFEVHSVDSQYGSTGDRSLAFRPSIVENKFTFSYA